MDDRRAPSAKSHLIIIDAFNSDHVVALGGVAVMAGWWRAPAERSRLGGPGMCVTQVLAQQPRRVGRLLVVDPCRPNNIFGVRTQDTLTKVLAERGWIQGQNLVFDCISAGERLWDIDKLATELVARQPEMIVTQSTPAIRALIAAKTTLPHCHVRTRSRGRGL